MEKYILKEQAILRDQTKGVIFSEQEIQEGN
jgi:hypothetical protein